MVTRRNFWDKIERCQADNDSLLCVGLDPVMDRLPETLKQKRNPIFEFNKGIIDSTNKLVCAYKPNIAFYEAEGIEGLQALKRTIDYIPSNIPVILDCKRGDIGHSSAAYAKGMFERFGADAITVSPYLGNDSIFPFAQYEDKGIYVLALTSNEGVNDFQYQHTNGDQLYETVAQKVSQWHKEFNNFGLVTGATHPEELKKVRKKAESLPFLIPGIGTQGGEIERSLKYAKTSQGIEPVIVVARSIIYADEGDDFRESSGLAAQKYKELINENRI